ncbi:MAG: S8 family serine peptidase [Chitinophagaceae bacterium]|nr:S8 family serine peptidase [Chitinophagaceae bacterium]
MEKLSPLLRQQINRINKAEEGLYNIICTDLAQLHKLLKQYPAVKLVTTYPATNMAVIQCTSVTLQQLLDHALIRFADKKQQPKEELLFGFVDYAFNRISTIQHYYPSLNGNGIVVSVKEQYFDTTDIDLKGRTLTSPYQAATISDHAGIMATMMAGGGNSWYNTKGAAWGAQISSASFSNLIPEPDTYYKNTPVLLQNHSYGTIVESYYGAEAAAYDASVNNNPSLLHVFSAGNSGTQSATTGNYAGIAGYSNLTGNFKHAKNIITVGHTDSFGIVLTPSSKGPAFDGRIKPELVAFGEDGSSGATALVSGIAAVLQQLYKQQHANTTAPASLIKAILLNNADDVDAPGIDYRSGYGSVNAYNAVTAMSNNQYVTGTVSNNTQQQFTISVPANTKQVKITLAWSDPAATANNSKALINDLDLTVTDVSSNTTFQPWVLNSAPSVAALQQLPVRKRDSLNVVEQVTIDLPSSGNYLITVNGYTITSATQDFSIAYSIEQADRFTWHFPTASDHLFPAQTNVVRFRSSYTTATGTLEISTDDTNSWQTIETGIDLSKGYYKLNTPAINSRAVLRMIINNSAHTGNMFTISQRPVMTVGFNCSDSVMLSWRKDTAATAYNISQLGSRYMEPLLVTADSFVVLPKQLLTAKHFAVTPVYRYVTAVRSYTFNYESQGAGCYIRSFLADKTAASQGLLSLELSTGYRVKAVRFEEYSRNGFILITEQPYTNNLRLSATDAVLIQGNNLYRAVVELQDGRLFYSDTAGIYHTGSKIAVVYPNPAAVKGSIRVLTEQDDLQFQLIDNIGRIVLQQPVNDYPMQVSLSTVQRGIYYYRLVKKNQKVQTGMLIVQ